MSQPTTESQTVRDLDPPRGRWRAVRIRRRTDSDLSSYDIDRRPNPGESVAMGDLVDPDNITDYWFSHVPTRETEPGYLFFSPDRASWGSYHHGTVERSNQRVFLERHSDVEGVHGTHGGYNSHGVVVRGDVDDPGVIRDLRMLCAETGYSTGLLDETDWQELRSELRRDAVRSWAVDDFWSEIETRAVSGERAEDFLGRARRVDVPGAPGPAGAEETLYRILDSTPQEERRELFWQCKERRREQFVFEDAVSAYIDTASLAKAVEPADLFHRADAR